MVAANTGSAVREDETVMAFVGEPGKIGLGSAGVCRSVFDAISNGKPRSSVDILLSRQHSYFRSFAFRKP